ncbi:prepilin peptidase [Lentzea sp. NPDC004782]|uniref:prepilin peptidase n=1 Tax=Lentzea sp. NPDC004782 TaxID=3154458 RepID=UPI0033A094CE
MGAAMSNWPTYGLLGAVAGPAVTVLSSYIAQCVPLSWGSIVQREWVAMLAASALLSATLVQATERHPASAGALAWLMIIGLLLTLTDWVSHRLPHRIVGALFSGGTVQFSLSALVQHDIGPLLRAGVAAAAVFAVGLVIYTSSSGLGFGDVTLSTTMAFFLGWYSWRHVAVSFVLALMIAAVVSLTLIARRRVHRGQPIALGPALIFGAVCTILQT